MVRITLLSALLICAGFAGVLLEFSSTETRAQTPPSMAGEDASHNPSPPIYNPYPPGILPSDLESEIARVRREVQGIFNQGVNEWRALPPPTLKDNPPVLQDSGYHAVQTLGKLMNFDENMSPFRNEACAVCRMPYAAFRGPIPSANLPLVAYAGTL